MAYENAKKAGIIKIIKALKGYFQMIENAVKTVNGEEPDENGNIQLNVVPLADGLESGASQHNKGTFIQRMAGGDASITDGDAWLMNIKATSIHEGYVSESLTWNCSNDSLTVAIDRDAFVTAYPESGTLILTYSSSTSSWSEDPSTYGITVTGSPSNNDIITVVYRAEERGEILVSNPISLIATGWNLYDNSVGYAKVKKYDYGYRVDGTYTSLKWSATLDGEQSDITVVDGNFDIPADGYIWVNGGNSTDTVIYATWEDWTEGSPEYQAYTESIVDLSNVMAQKFPYGLLKAGSAVDEIDLNLGQTISRVERMAYSEVNRAAAESSGREYEFDDENIYLARANPVISSVTVNGSFTVSDHGLEYFSGTDAAVEADILYGQNLKNKLERDVLTISQQTLNAAQQAQVMENIGAASLAALGIVGSVTSKLESETVYVATATNTHLSSITLNKGVYIVQAVASFAANGTGLRQLYLSLTRAGSLLNRFCTATNASVASGAITRIALTSILEVTQDNTVIYLVGNQTSGSLLSVDGIGMQAVRLK